jgi:hypothetical protein
MTNEIPIPSAPISLKPRYLGLPLSWLLSIFASASDSGAFCLLCRG